MSKHAVVTGAGGYIGRHLVTALIERGMRVTAVTRGPLEAGRLDPRAEHLVLDVLGELDAPFAALGEPDIVLHLAWQDGFRHDAPSHMGLLSAHYRLLTRLVDEGLPQLVVLGSMHELGYIEGQVGEDAPSNPRSLYGVAKSALRASLELAIRDRAVLQWARCFYVYGDDRSNNSIFTKILEAADAGRRSFPFTSGRNRYDFVDVDELGRQLAAIAAQTEVAGVINCGSGVPVSLADQVQAFIAENGLDIELEFGAFPDRPYDSPAIWADVSKLRSITG